MDKNKAKDEEESRSDDEAESEEGNEEVINIGDSDGEENDDEVVFLEKEEEEDNTIDEQKCNDSPKSINDIPINKVENFQTKEYEEEKTNFQNAQYRIETVMDEEDEAEGNNQYDEDANVPAETCNIQAKEFTDNSHLKTHDEISGLNVELNNQNEFINMNHFDEASRIGFAINNNDGKLQKSELNPGSPSVLELNNNDVDKFQFEDESCSPIKKVDSRKNLAENDKQNSEAFLDSPDSDGIQFQKAEYTHEPEIVNKKESIKRSKVQGSLVDEMIDSEVLNLFHKVNKTNTFQKFLKTQIKEHRGKSNNLSLCYNKNNSQNLSGEKIHLKNISLKKDRLSKNVSSDINKLIEVENKCKVLFDEKEELEIENRNLHLENEKLAKNFNTVELLDTKLKKKEELLESLVFDKGEIEEQNQLLKKDVLNMKTQIENMKVELNVLMSENDNKNEKIAELQQVNFDIEQEFRIYKNRSNTELTNLRDSRSHMESLKSNYYDIKNQYELLNMKYQSIADENFNIKRDMLLYEKEIKNKNDIIERLRNEIINTTKKNYASECNDRSSSSLNLNLNLNNILKGNSNYVKRDNQEVSNSSPDYNTSDHSKGNFQELKSDSQSADNSHILPSQKANLDKEYRLKIVETKLYKFNRERDKIQIDLNKLPEYPRKRDLIMKRRELEEAYASHTKDIAKLKQELKELNAIKREF